MAIKFFCSFIIALSCIQVSYSAVFTIKNNCPFTIWPATLTGSGSQALTGVELGSKASTTITISSPWSGRFWARYRCSNSGRFTCESADCGSGKITCNGAGGKPPATLVEFTLGGANQRDFYDISLVDGFNLPVSVAASTCPVITCPANINSGCPNELAVKGSGGNVVGCNSACVAFNQPQYCCTGTYGSPTTCKPTNYSQIFKSRCPQAYSYAYDDKSSTFTCPTGANYAITFCT